MRLRLAGILLLVSGLPGNALALPRFAARNGGECLQCHVNPTGGGIRNAYGRNVFARQWLPWSMADDGPDWNEPESAATNGEAGATRAFDADLTESLALGADLRTAYLFIRPDKKLPDADDRAITNTFFLMQADLYHSAALTRFMTVAIDVGVYSGFEAWALFDLVPSEGDVDVRLKVGRFMPPFGIREVEHQLFTRERIGLGTADRDTGVELAAYLGPVTWITALLNGTQGETSFDTSGTERRDFEKAVSSRLSVRGVLGDARLQLGTSYYFGQNVSQANPLFAGALPSELQPEVSRGANEQRGGVFATASLGRFTYLGEIAGVRDDFYAEAIPRFQGYASYQELSFIAHQGLELVATAEFADPDTRVANNVAKRAGLVVEFFPVQFTELRLMVRRLLDDTSTTGGTWDAVAFGHFFF